MEALGDCPGSLVPPTQRAKPGCKTVLCGAGDGSPPTHCPRPPQRGSGPLPPAPRTGGSGRENAGPRTPLMKAQGTSSRRPCAAPAARKASSQERALLGWLRSPTPAAPWPTKKGQRTAAARPKDRRSGEGDCPTPDTPHKATRHSPKATSSCPHGAQCQPPRACAVGLITGPHARTPCASRTKGSVPQPPAQTTDSRGRGSVESPGYHSTPPGNGKGDTMTELPPPQPTTGRARPEQEAQRGTNRLERLHQRPTRGPREGRTPKGNKRWGDATTAGARAHKRKTERRRAPRALSECLFFFADEGLI